MAKNQFGPDDDFEAMKGIEKQRLMDDIWEENVRMRKQKKLKLREKARKPQRGGKREL